MVAAGWGLDEGGRAPTVLNKASMTLVSDDDCQRRYGRLSRNGVLCAQEDTSANNGGAVCNGDSGGFLGSPRNGRMEQDGVVSFGARAGCGLEGFYDGFTEVYGYLDWIEETRRKNA